MQTESSQPVEETKLIDVADVPKPIEAEAGTEELPALMERGKISLEQFSDIFANIEKAMSKEAAEKASLATPIEAAPLSLLQQEAKRKAELNLAMGQAAANTEGVPGQRNIVESNDTTGQSTEGMITGPPAATPEAPKV